MKKCRSFQLSKRKFLALQLRGRLSVDGQERLHLFLQASYVAPQHAKHQSEALAARTILVPSDTLWVPVVLGGRVERGIMICYHCGLFNLNAELPCIIQRRAALLDHELMQLGRGRPSGMCTHGAL